MLGGRVVTTVLTSQFQGEFCKLAEICKTEKLLSAGALSVNQKINKTGTLPHGIAEVAISTKLQISKTGTWYHTASLDLLLAKTGNQQNWNLTLPRGMQLWSCCFAKTQNS